MVKWHLPQDKVWLFYEAIGLELRSQVPSLSWVRPPWYLFYHAHFAFEVWTLRLRVHISPDSLAPDQWLRRISIKLQLPVNFDELSNFRANDESYHEYEIWKIVLGSIRKVSNLVLRTLRTTSLRWKVVLGKRIGPPIGNLSKIDLTYFGGFKCALEGCYRHMH